MKIRQLTSEDHSAMEALFRADCSSLEVEYYIDRGDSFWRPYLWYESESLFAWGVFAGARMVGMLSLVKLPFKIRGLRDSIYLNTDFFVHPEFRKSVAAMMLLKAMQKNLPEPDIFEIGVENRPDFLSPLERLSKKFGHRTVWLKPTVLSQYFPQGESIIASEASQSLTFDLTEEEIDGHMKVYLAANSGKSSIAFSESFRLSRYPKVKPGIARCLIQEEQETFSCLIVDKSALQKIRWNGKANVTIEKFRRRLAQNSVHQEKYFEPGDELKYFHVCFPVSSSLKDDFLKRVQAHLSRLAIRGGYFSWTIRDWRFPLVSDLSCDRVDFSRRVPFTMKDGYDYGLDLVPTLNQERILIESVFL